jgi:cytosine/adenosine deaminase-related metal-dependent hydrolase
MKKALVNATLFDWEQYKENRFVLFDDFILATGPMAEFKEEGIETIDCQGMIVMPSLCLGHTHVYSAFARGLSLPFHPATFRQLLEQLWWKLDAKLDHEMVYYSGITAAADFLKNGVTAIVDHHASGTDMTGSLSALKTAVCDEAGMRGIFCFETSDRFDVSLCLQENLHFLKQKSAPRSSGMFGLHASMTLSEATLNGVKRVLGLEPIHIHVAESQEDEQDCQTKYGCRIVERLDRHGLLNEGSILAHCLHVDDAELDIIQKRNCVIALNVTSNMNNGVGLPDFLAIRKHGVKTIIGNDGIASSATTEYLNLYFAAHLQNGVNAFGLSDLRRMISDTYDFVGTRLGVKLGKIRPGFAADLLTIPYVPPTPIDARNAFGHLFFGLFNSFRPKNVFVAGERLVTDYQLLPALEAKTRKAARIAARLWDNLRKEDEPHELDD